MMKSPSQFEFNSSGVMIKVKDADELRQYILNNDLIKLYPDVIKDISSVIVGTSSYQRKYNED